MTPSILRINPFLLHTSTLKPLILLPSCESCVMGNQPSKSPKQQRKDIASQSGLSLKVVTAMCEALERRAGGNRFLTGDYLDIDSKELRQSVYHAVDTNQDGKMSVEEYVRFLIQIGRGSMEHRLKELFLVFDANGDGYISRDEVSHIFKAADEICKREYDSRRAEGFFNTVDLDGDGRLTCDEFVRAANTDASIKADLEEIRKIILGLSTEIVDVS